VKLKGVTYEGKPCEFFLDEAAIATVYSGRHGCACGCRGKHTKNTPGNARSIANVVARILATPEDKRVVAIANKAVWQSHVSVETPTRLYIAYLAPTARPVLLAD
jgi:hypothetical protein